MFDLKAAGYSDPILVSGTDGVGTKLMLALRTGIHNTVGIDLVAMCANDVLAQGAEPLFFLDYFATGKLEEGIAEAVISGIAEGCHQSGCALVGGETAEMPGMYPPGHYDLAGFVVGAVDRDKVLPRMDTMVAGDLLIGIASSGPHSNGYSLIRRIVEREGLSYDSASPFSSQTLGEALLTPTRLYAGVALPLIRKGLVKGLAHITGGGLTENTPRMCPDHLVPVIERKAWTPPPVFEWLQSAGNVAEERCTVPSIWASAWSSPLRRKTLIQSAPSCRQRVSPPSFWGVLLPHDAPQACHSDLWPWLQYGSPAAGG